MLTVSNLTKVYNKNDVLPAVSDVSFSIYNQRSLALIGESGCGKTTVAKLIMGLEKPTAGSIMFDGIDVARAHPRLLRSLRKRVQMIFQCSKSVFNPSYTIADSIREVLLAHERLSPDEALARVDDVFDLVCLPKSLQQKYPSQLSGGQCQRANIARSLILQPELLICDEPLASLDYSTRFQIIELLQEIQRSRAITYVFITHDLSNVHEICHDVAIMYKGKIVEHLPACACISGNVKHPYSVDLFASLPCSNPHMRRFIYEPVKNCEYDAETHDGCLYKNRCDKRLEVCEHTCPALRTIVPGQMLACHAYGACAC